MAVALHYLILALRYHVEMRAQVAEQCCDLAAHWQSLTHKSQRVFAKPLEQTKAKLTKHSPHKYSAKTKIKKRLFPSSPW
jgi:hypothetical protein